jgi:3-methylcrotonyl-CoA carboxylase alpha subunit/geranyl-CoA carboxylase alpha subunit
MRILIANRGEIARRIVRTAARLGHETVAVYADPDREAPFVGEATLALRLGPAALDASYLSIDRLLDAARRSDATAVHPGYGFLSESADFARAVAGAGLIWIGPHPKAIERMGSKIEARGLAASAGVPTIPGFDLSQDPEELAKAAKDIGYPVLVKAAAGGGGKGIRIVRDASGFDAALAEATREAERAFGSSAVIVERYIERARHVEVQIVGDRHGNLIDLGTRECSVQRRYQKLLEEAPAPNLPEQTRTGLRESARELGRSIGYDSTGTVEFVVDDDSGDYFFLEMNTRLQVEHPVTEAVTGLDLVELQLACAEGEPLPLAQGDVQLRGHAIEVRINAEDPAAGFAPQVGVVTDLRIPDGVRWEGGVEAGSEVTPHYDSMLAKLIAHGPDRKVALRRLAIALDELLVGGLVTNTGLHRWLVDQPPIVRGRVTTSYLDGCELPDVASRDEAPDLAARAWRAARREARGPAVWSALGSIRLTPHRPNRTVALADLRGDVHEIALEDGPASLGSHLIFESEGVLRRVPAAVDLRERRVALNLEGQTHTFRVRSRSEHWAPSASGEGADASEATRSPFPAIVTDTPVAPGDAVTTGDVVVVIEAMKMLHSLLARGRGVVRAVHVAVGESVESNQVLVSYEPAGGDENASGGDEG